MAGTLEILIRRCDNLHDVGSWGDREIDPFVKCIPSWLTKDKQTNWRATKSVDDAGVNVVFDQIKHDALLKFDLPEKADKIKPALLSIEVYDYDPIGGNDFVGSGEVDLYKLLSSSKDKKELEFTVALTRPKRKKIISAGTAFIKVQIVPPSAPPPKKKLPAKKKGKRGGKKSAAVEAPLTPRSALAGTKEAFAVLKKGLDESGFDIKEAFETADDDADGTSDGNATLDEFQDMLVDVVNDGEMENGPLTEAQIKLIIQHIDSDNNGTINLEEFQMAMDNKIVPGSILDNILAQMAEIWAKTATESFELFDGDASGDMDYDEFEENLTSLFEEMELKQEDVKAITKHFDQDLDGKIKSQEFRAALESKTVPTMTTVTMTDEQTGDKIEKEINVEELEQQKTSAERVREQRTMPIDMGLKEGTLEIRVKRGDLSHDTSGMLDRKMDPYVRVRYGHTKTWSSTKYCHNQHKYPNWTEKENNLFSFPFDPSATESVKKPLLKVECWDDKVGLDASIGTGDFNLTRLLSSQPGAGSWREYKVELLHKGRAAGDLYVDLRYVTKETKADDSAKRGEAKVHNDKEMEAAGVNDVADLVGASDSVEDFVPPGMIGIMIKSGKGLYNVGGPIMDTMDPYVAIIPSWLPKEQAHKTATVNNGGKNCTWKKKDSPFGHFRIEEMSGGNSNGEREKYTVRLEVVDDNVLNDTLIGTAIFDVRSYIDVVGDKLLMERAVAVKEGKDPSDIKISADALVDVPVKLVRANGKDAGELIVGVRFTHTAGAPPSESVEGAFTNEASTGDVDQDKTCGTLEVTIMEAMNLKDSDWLGGESDPFVQLHLEPLASKEAKQCRALECAETRVKNGAGRRARFDETFRLPVFRTTSSSSSGSTSPVRKGKGVERLANRRLRLTVKDKDPRFLGLGSDDVLGTAVQDLAVVLQVGAVTADIPLESSAGGKKLSSKLKVKTKFIPADPIQNISDMHRRSGKLQIYVQEGKNLKNVESMLFGDQDPYCSFRLIHADDDADNNATPKWSSTRYINGGGRNVVFGDWIEVRWTKEMMEELRALAGLPEWEGKAEEEEKKENKEKGESKESDASFSSFLNQSKFRLQIAVWDENGLRSDKLIGSSNIQLDELLRQPSGASIELTESKLGGGKVSESGAKSTGQLKIAAQFIPDPITPEISVLSSIEKGTIKMHVVAIAGGRLSGSISSSSTNRKDLESLSMRASIRRTSDDTTIDKKNSVVSTEYCDVVKVSDDALVPCTWNQVVAIPWRGEGKPADVATPTMHLEVATRTSKSKETVVGRLTLPLTTLTSCVEHASGTTWLPLDDVDATKYGIGSGVRACVSWQFFPEIERENIDSESMSKTFDSLPLEGFTLSPPVVVPGKLHVKVLEAKNLPAGQMFGTSDPFPEAKLTPGGETARAIACEDGGKNPHWDWTSTPAWTFLVEDAGVTSLEVSIYNEKAWISQQITGSGMMGTCHLSLPSDIMSRANPKTPESKWYQMSMPKDKIKKKKKTTKKDGSDNNMPMVLVETWFEHDGGEGSKAVGWAPTKGSGRPIPFFPTPPALGVAGTLYIQPEEAFDLRNMESAWLTQDPYVKINLICGNDKKPAGTVKTNVAYDRGSKASWDGSTKPYELSYTTTMGDNAIAAGSTPYIQLEVWDKNKLFKDVLIGRCEVPILPLMGKNSSSIFSRTLSLMDEGQAGSRGKLSCKLQFLPDDADEKKKPFSLTSPLAPPAIGGDLTMSVVKARELVQTNFMGAQDPFVRVSLSRGGFRSVEFGQEEEEKKESNEEKEGATPREAISLKSSTNGMDDGTGAGSGSYTTRTVEDGGDDPVWDEPPFVLTTLDAAFDMLRVEIVNEENQAVIGNFELPLLEVLNLEKKEGGVEEEGVEEGAAAATEEGVAGSALDSAAADPALDSAAGPPMPVSVSEGWYPVFRCEKEQAPERRGELRLEMKFARTELSTLENEIPMTYGPVKFLSGTGFVHVTVVSARSIKQTGDLYVQMKMFPIDAPGPSHPSEHGYTRRTEVDERTGGKSGDNDPRWNTSYVVPLQWKPGDERPPILTFELKKKATMGGGTLGNVTLDIAPFVLFPGQPASMWLPLGKDGKDGELLVNVQFVDAKGMTPPFPRSVMSTIRSCTHKGDVDLTINKARNLAVVQWQVFGKQDPFVRAKVYGGSLGCKGVTTETRSKKNGGTNAVWMEQLQVSFNDEVLPPGTSSTPLMEFQVFDKNDNYASTKIGQCLVPMFPFQMNDGHTGENWFPIRTGKGKETMLAGEIHVASQWLPEGMLAGARGPKLSGDRPLYIQIVSARGLPQVKTIEKQDPFVTIEIMGQDSQVSSAPAIDQAHSPSWNAYFPLPMSDTEFSGESPTISFTVRDKGSIRNEFIAKCDLQLPDDVMSPPYKKLVLKNHPLLNKKGNPTTATIWIEISREPFEGMEGRDDGIGRGEGQTTFLEDVGEDEDDDGLADGRLHVELLNVSGVPQLEGRDLKNRGCKLKVQLDPPGKSRVSRKCPSTSGKDGTLSFVFSDASKGVGEGSKMNSMVLPHTVNDDGRGSVEFGESLLTVWLIEPKKGYFGKDTVVASGSITKEMFRKLVVDPKVTASDPLKIPIALKSGVADMGSATATIKLQYVPAMSGRFRINVKQAKNLKNVARMGVQDPMCTIVLGSFGTVRTEEATDGGDRPKWKNNQRFISYTNATQKAPEELKISLKNNGMLGRDIGSCIVPIQPIIATAGNESTTWYTLKTEKGNSAGEIEISLMFTKDLGEESNMEQATKEEEQDGEDETVAIVASATKETPYVPPPRVVERQVKRKEQKRKQLDAGARLKLLKDLFYQIDKSGDKMVNQEELASMLESISTDYEILEVFLREKCGLDSIAGGDNVIEDDAENEEGGGGKLTSAVILRAIDSDDDGMISFEEWCRFLGDGHQNHDPLDDDAAPEVVKASKKTEDFRRLQKIQDAADTSKAQEAARERERLAKEKKRMALLDEREAAIALDKKRKEDAIQRKLQELEDEKRRMAEEKGRRAELERTKALSDEQKNKKIQMLEERNKAAMEAMERDRARREQERTIERKKLQKAKKKRKKMQKSMEEKRVPRPPDNMISHWRPYHVVEWLEKKLDLGQYSEAFANSSVDGLLLISLSDKDMRTTLGIRRRLHRAKIGVHVRRLAELSGMESREWDPENQGSSNKGKRSSKKGGTTVEWGNNGGASNPAAPELLRMQLEKMTKKRKQKMANTDAEDAVHGGYWAFEYDNPRNADVVTQADAWDFDDDWADQFGDDGAFDHANDELDDEYDRPADEENFRNAMKEVWSQDAQKAQMAGMSIDALNAFGGTGGANAAYEAADNPFTLVTKFAGENNMSFFQALQTPEIKRLRLRLKTGHSVYSAAAEAIKCRQLPPEYWFTSEAPWWMTLKSDQGLSGQELHDKGVQPRKIPHHATTEEVLTTVRQAVLEYGRYLHEQKKQELDPESLSMELEEKHKRIGAMRVRQGLPAAMEHPLSLEEDRLLSDAYQAMSRMQNNTTIIAGKGGSWTGTHNKLNRLKFQGSTKVLLKLNMNWQQFDAVFRAISTNADGTIQEDEFVAAFRSSAELADLLKNVKDGHSDNIGESSRQGGKRRRLLKAKGFHGIGAKTGDTEAQQIHDALDAILQTLEETRINLREAFESFDRSANGSISVAEFASLIKTLGGLGLSKRQVYRLASSMDADFDRTVQYNEFMEYFLVIWVERLRGLRREAGRPDKSLPEIEQKRKMIKAKRRLKKAEHAIKITFGSGFQAAAANAGAVLPGAFSALTRKMNMETTMIQSTFMPMSPTGRSRVERAKNAVVMGSSAPPRSPLRPTTESAPETGGDGGWGARIGSNKDVRAPEDLKRQGRVNVAASKVTIAGKQTLQRYKLDKSSKKLRGEEAGPITKSYGKHGIREIGMAKQKDAFAGFPSDFVPSNSF